MYPGNPLNLTHEDVLKHYKGKGFKPLTKNTMNAMIRELFLYMVETLAFYKDLISHGTFEGDGADVYLQASIDALKGYIEYLDSHRYDNA